MVRNLTKNFFAILHYNTAFALLAVLGILIVNLGPFVGLIISTGFSSIGYVLALLALALIYVGMSWHSDISPIDVVLHPIGTILFTYAIVRSVVLTLVRGGVVWRGTWYSLAELRKFTREEPSWNWL
jgi:hypothetical protein